MNRISRNLSIILRSERLIAQRRLAVLRRQTGMMVAAAIVGGIGLIMLNAAAYLALSSWTSPAVSALIVAVANLALAALLASIATNTTAEAEITPVAEVRDLAMEDLEAEMQGAAQEVRELTNNVRRVASDPLGIGGAKVLGTALTTILKNIKK